ncbi:HlyD family efflux transporter periplasmic adaptor subunit [Rhodospirillum sp. A1_3_36]|uniref:HlyD family efflux transporter periplasmic adaptor subunit n=1 Tax=Rhodospirillum sp. A1_3_36 TaxID=3391666 RepID=UPI0039A6CA18
MEGTVNLPEVLPPLRRDLRLLPAAPEPGGAPMWTIHDPVRDRFFKIGALARDLLARWSAGKPVALLADVTRARPEDLSALIGFLFANELLEMGGAQARSQRLERLARSKRGWGGRLLHGYLFLRVPLVRPDRFLNRVVPVLRPLLTRRTAWLIALLGLLGVLLTLRQWDLFLTTAVDTFTLDGLGAFGLALIGAKVLHETGHAVAAKALGCRVRAMGVAFLVLWPVLYTDTTDAWRLTNRRHRLLIGAAGMLVELSLACCATLAWALLPDGPLRGGAFVLASVTWISSLAVNLNPFMRFDGYYLLSDLLGVDNLQQRSFALARWRMRRILLGFRDAAPEVMDRGRRHALIAHAWGTWIYRFFLFLGIAFLVYHLFFKVLGIFMMMVEIVWFLGRPIWSEVRVWAQRKDEARWTVGGLIALLSGLGLVALLLFPWRGQVTAFALLEAPRATEIRAPFAARLEALAVVDGQEVTKGQLLLRFGNPDTAHALAGAEAEIAGLRLRLDRVAADADSLAVEPVMREALAEALARRDLLVESEQLLTVTAPHGGIVRDLNPDLEVGQWIRPQGDPLARVVSSAGGQVVAFLEARDLPRLEPGVKGTFRFDDPARAPLTLRLKEVEQTAITTLADPSLAAAHGGRLPTRTAPDGRLVPTEPFYRARLVVEGQGINVLREEWGRIALPGERASLAGRFLRHALAVLVRESGF